MKNATRELLLITNAARTWSETHFSEQVNELMTLAGKVDNPAQIDKSSEVLDVYHHRLSTAGASGDQGKENVQRPFAFTAFRN